jgi:hypothetical protein
VFPASNPWNTRVDGLAVAADSARTIAAIGADQPLHPDFGTRYGIPYTTVGRSTKRVRVGFAYAGESDRGPYPLPRDVPLEDGSDAHAIDHALRFTVARTRDAFVFPARHAASSLTDAALPAMGQRLRLRASFDVSRFPRQARIVLVALQRYGMLVADNGSDWYVTGAPSPHWDDDALHTLSAVRGSDFEVVAAP